MCVDNDDNGSFHIIVVFNLSTLIVMERLEHSSHSSLVHFAAHFDQIPARIYITHWIKC